MRQLLPGDHELALDDLYDGLTLVGPVGDRSGVSLGMVASVDGAVTVDGRSGPIGGAADRVAFRRLRRASDAIVVGAGTARAEDYGPPRGRDGGGPQLLVVTASAGLDPGARLFRAPRDPGVPPPAVVTCATAPADRVDALREVAQVVVVGEDRVDLSQLLRWTLERGWPRVLCEGGPALNGDLLRAGLVDEVLLTIAPLLVGGDARRIVQGAAASDPLPLELVAAHEHDGELVLRYGRRPERGRPSDEQP